MISRFLCYFFWAASRSALLTGVMPRKSARDKAREERIKADLERRKAEKEKAATASESPGNG